MTSSAPTACLMTLLVQLRVPRTSSSEGGLAEPASGFPDPGFVGFLGFLPVASGVPAAGLTAAVCADVVDASGGAVAGAGVAAVVVAGGGVAAAGGGVAAVAGGGAAG